jgi:uncharacterized protein YebE (UPF0316 family)
MEFLQQSSIWVYMFIFFGKIIEVAVATVRMVLINRGERLKGALIAIVEIYSLAVYYRHGAYRLPKRSWKVVVFAAAYALGNYLGSWMEDKLAFGLSSVQVITPDDEKSEQLVSLLRGNDFAVTTIKGRGKDGQRELMLLHIKRKRIPEAVAIIKREMDKAVIVVNDSKVVQGGFIKK